MKKYSWMHYLFRIFTFLLIFEILHYSYDLFPNLITQIFSAVEESIFQHWKITFFTYILLSVIEFFIFRPSIHDKAGFFFNHVLIAVLIPWFIFILWYIVVAIFGQIFTVWVEIVYAILITVITIIFFTIIEQPLEQVKWTLPSKIVIIIVFALLLMEFIVFTFKLPWVDVFTSP